MQIEDKSSIDLKIPFQDLPKKKPYWRFTLRIAEIEYKTEKFITKILQSDIPLSISADKARARIKTKQGRRVTLEAGYSRHLVLNKNSKLKIKTKNKKKLETEVIIVKIETQFT